MQRGLVALATAALLCGVSLLLIKSLATGDSNLADLVLLTAACTLTLGVLGAVAGLGALLRVRALQADLQRLSRSLDAAVRDLTAKAARETSALDDLASHVSREIESITVRASARPRPPQEPRPAGQESRGNIVALVPGRRVRADDGDAATAPQSADGFELPVQLALAAGEAEISLQPVISIPKGTAVGFEAFVHVEREDGTSIDLKRLPFALPAVPHATFESWMLRSAIAAACGAAFAGAADGMPLYVQASEALLTDSPAFEAVVQAFKDRPSAATTIVVCLPSSILERPGRYAEALDTLTELGVRTGADFGAGGKDAIERLKRTGVAALRIHADRLLGRIKAGKNSPSPGRLIDLASAADLPVIAIDVDSDEDAVTMIDLGATLMTGNRFSLPRRLRQEAAAAGDRIAQQGRS